MRHYSPRTQARRIRLLVGLGLFSIFCFQCHRLATSSGTSDAAIAIHDPGVAYAALVGREPEPIEDPMGRLARRDPLGFFHQALDRYERSVHDYTCTFTKQERVGTHLTKVQVTDVDFRESPYSVDMVWTQNADKARRALYVDGRWTNDKGQKLAVVEPAGAIAQLFVDHVLRPINGEDAKRAARRRIDQFGFKSSLELIIKFCEKAKLRNELQLRYVGQGSVNDRPTYVFERHLPYNGDESLYPDRVLIVHVDKEYLLPTYCVAYGDDARQKLLGSYKITNVHFNVGLTDANFDPDEKNF